MPAGEDTEQGPDETDVLLESQGENHPDEELDVDREGESELAAKPTEDVVPPLDTDPALAAIAGLEKRIADFHERASGYETIIRQMQTRIEDLQGDQVQTLLRPLIQRFASLHSQSVTATHEARDRGELAEKDFAFFATAIEEALGLIDIESIGAEPGASFDSRQHHASRIVPTTDPDLDQRIDRVTRQGFTYIGAPRVFLPAQVSVFRHERAPIEPNEDDKAIASTNTPRRKH